MSVMFAIKLKQMSLRFSRKELVSQLSSLNAQKRTLSKRWIPKMDHYHQFACHNLMLLFDSLFICNGLFQSFDMRSQSYLHLCDNSGHLYLILMHKIFGSSCHNCETHVKHNCKKMKILHCRKFIDVDQASNQKPHHRPPNMFGICGNNWP